MTSDAPTLLLVAALALAPALLGAAAVAGGADIQRAGSPPRLSGQEFLALMTELSEADGFFRSDNLVSNELFMQRVIPDLTRIVKPGRVYLGVGPEQNFTYMAAVKPAMAFIIDVRRGNLQLHLMYKALFELSVGPRGLRLAPVLAEAAGRPRPQLVGAGHLRRLRRPATAEPGALQTERRRDQAASSRARTDWGCRRRI